MQTNISLLKDFMPLTSLCVIHVVPEKAALNSKNKTRMEVNEIGNIQTEIQTERKREDKFIIILCRLKKYNLIYIYIYMAE